MLVVRREAGGDDSPEVGRLELVGLRESGDGGLQEVTLGGGGTLGLGYRLSTCTRSDKEAKHTVAVLDTGHLEHSLRSGGSDDTGTSG